MNQPLPLPYGRGSVGERVPGVQSRARQQAATAFMVPMRVQTLEVEAFHEPRVGPPAKEPRLDYICPRCRFTS